MFKIESYVTPYISAYFKKYVQDFNQQDFQVSIWQGGATFTNVNLNLEAVEAELNLPVTLISGHIHELKISVPWTKLTSESILVHVKTIEITLKLKSPSANSSCRKEIPVKSKSCQEVQVPPGYIESIMNKITNNVKIICENVILKYIEEDIVLSLNLKTAVLSCVNSEWKPAFVDLAAPNFMLRKLLACSDLTICLDKTNSSGKIETYQEPLLYKCSFDVRIMQQYYGYFSKCAYFTRLDFFLNEMKFSITDEQIPMVLRLYNLLTSLSASTPLDRSLFVQTETDLAESEGEQTESDEGSMWRWAADFVSQLPEALLGPMDESTEPLGPCEFSDPIVHFGFYINVATIIFKGIERTHDKTTHGQTRVRYVAFLKCNLQGIVYDYITRGSDFNSRFGISKMVIDGIGVCPCGLKDCVLEDSAKSVVPNPLEYVSVGKTNPAFSKDCLFDPAQCALGDVRPPADYDFKYDGHVESYTEEHMLNRTPGIAMEVLSVTLPLVSSDEIKTELEDEDIKHDPKTEQSLSRLVIGPSKVKLCSGSIHRAKVLFFSAQRYGYEPYGDLSELLKPYGAQLRSDALLLEKFQNAQYKLQFTIIKPVIEILAADHPDYDLQSHVRAYYKKRQTAHTTPLSYVVPNWPKLILSCDTVDASYSQPNVYFRKVIQAWNGPVNHQLAELFADNSDIMIHNIDLNLVSGDFKTVLFYPFNLRFTSVNRLKPCLGSLTPGTNITDVDLKISNVKVKFAKPHLMMCQIIIVSCCDEKMSEHLCSSTILEDLPNYKKGDIVVESKDLSGSYATISGIAAYRVIVGGAIMQVVSPNYKEPIVVFEGPKEPSTSEEDNKLALLIFQTPLSPKSVNVDLSTATRPIEVHTPIFILKLSPFKLHSDLRMFDWIDYTPQVLKSSMVLGVTPQKSSQSLYPAAPLYVYQKSDVRFERVYSNSSDEGMSQESASRSNYSGIYEMYRTPHASTHAKTTTTSSIPDSTSHDIGTGRHPSVKSSFRHYKRRPSLEEEFFMLSPRAFVQTWERWIVKHLHLVKKTLMLIRMEGIEWRFPIREKKCLDPEEPILGSFVINCPVFSVHPQGTPGGVYNGQFKLPVALPAELKNRDLFPLRVQCSLSGFSENQKLTRIPFLSPVDILLTVTMADKIIDGKPPVIASCVHSDIPSVKLEFCYPQIKLLARFVENSLRTTAFFVATVPSLLMPPLEAYEIDGSPSGDDLKEASRAGSVGDTSQLSQPPGNHFDCSASSLNDSSEIPLSVSLEKLPGSNLLENNGLDNTVATFWVQMPLAQFQLTLTDSATGEKSDATHQLVLEVEDILSHLDVHMEYVKWSFKVSAMSLRLYQMTPEGWSFGKCLGVIMSCNEELTRDIRVLQSSAPKRSTNESSAPSGSTAAGTTGQQHRVLAFTFTRVVAKDFHWKSEISSPIVRWNTVLQKYYDKDYIPYEEVSKRVLSEFDIKLKSLDFLLSPLLLTPFVPSFQELLNIEFPRYVPVEVESKESLAEIQNELKQTNIPSLNNNTVPLIYLETESIRIFFKAEEVLPATFVPNVAILKISSIKLHSQSENPMHRTLIKPDLYRLAEQARIIFTPGSPLEDRQYQTQIRGLSLVTCHWNHIEANSRRKFTQRSRSLLKTMGENPAFEWNTIDTEWSPVEVIAQPILDRLDFSVAFSPAIVYQKVPDSPSSSVVVGGHSFELNITSSVYLNISLHQLSTLIAITNEIGQIYTLAAALLPLRYPLSEEFDSPAVTPAHSVVSSVREVDSGVDSLHLLSINDNFMSKGSELFGTSTNLFPFAGSLMPLDVLITVSHIQLTLYRLLYSHHEDKEQREPKEGSDEDKIIGMVPVIFAAVEQPHFVLALGATKQKMEVSIFDLYLSSGNSESKSVIGFTLPQKNDFSEVLFESLEGERNPRTGMRTAFCTIKILDFWQRPCIVYSELFHPVRVVFNQKRLNLVLFKEFIDLLWPREERKEHGSSSSFVTSLDRKEHPIRIILGYVHTARVAFSQVVLEVHESPEGLPHAAIAFSVSSIVAQILSQEKYGTLHGKPVGHIRCSLSWSGAVISTSLGETDSKKDILLNPWSGNVAANVKWYKWLKVPCSIIRVTTDAATLFVGPQNVLALLHLYNTFKEYVEKVFSGDEIVEILEALPQIPHRIQLYTDNFKLGSLKYIVVSSEMDFPEVYQAAFCNQAQTLTWRYPEPRVISRIEADNIPLEVLLAKTNKASLDCTIEYWDEAQNQFCGFITFKLYEVSGGPLVLPVLSKPHDYASTLWRAKILSTQEEQRKWFVYPLKPHILAACLDVDSKHDSTMMPKLKLCIEIPRISINLLNHLKFAGRLPEESLCLYSIVYGGLSSNEQQFAALEFSSIKFVSHMWLQRVSVECQSTFKGSIMDYSFLTDINVVDSFNILGRFTMIEENFQKVFSEIDIMTSPIIVKVGASTLHTIGVSLLSWHQVFNGFCGDGFKYNDSHLQAHVPLTQIFICNDTATKLALLQENTSSHLIIYGRQCYAYFWHSQKCPPKLKVGLPLEGRIKWSAIFCSKQRGKFVRKIDEKTPVFIQISQLSSTQTKITVSGAFVVGNALQEAIEVGCLLRFASEELSWTLESRSHMASQFIDVAAVEHIRFRFADTTLGDHHGWSDVITLDQLRKAGNKSIIVSMYEDRDECLYAYNVWCTLVEENWLDCTRNLIVICPFFRMRSALSIPTTAKIATVKNDNASEFVLEGRGSELQINFLGEADVAHHLAFRTKSGMPSSRPTVPLLPGGPISEKILHSPIDSILENILGVQSQNETSKFDIWPYIGEAIPVTEWALGSQPETEFQISFGTWISGLPSILIEARPWALFVNMIGGTLLFCEATSSSGSANFEPKVFDMPNMCTFSPSKVEGEFKFGVELPSRRVWTENIQFTREKSRTDIHHVNSNWKIPVDCISRLEIHGEYETVHLTLEAKERNSVLILSIRPTFCVQNRTKLPLRIKGFTLSKSKVVSELDLDLEKGVTALDSVQNTPDLDESSGAPLTSFTCDWDTLTETDINKSGMKYIGLSTRNGPFWFVQLMKFELIFNNMSADQGIQAKRQCIALHSCQPTFVSGDRDGLLKVTIALSISWICKSGQIWISIAEDKRPQLVIHNITNIPFIYAEGNVITEGPHDELSPFPQYHFLPAFSRGHYAFPSTQSMFPDLTTTFPNSLSLLIGKPSHIFANSSFRRLSMIFPDYEKLEWSKRIKCENPERSQPIHIGKADEISYLKVHMERLGHTYYAFIEQMSNAEVSAKDIRGRICSQSTGEYFSGELSSLTTIKPPTLEINLSGVEVCPLSSDSLERLGPDCEIIAPPPSFTCLGFFNQCPMRFGRICLSEIRLILTDDFTYLDQKRELLGVTIRDVMVDMCSETDGQELRILNYRPQESTWLRLCLGDIQIDNALYAEKMYDFPVILLKEDKYEPRLTQQHLSFDTLSEVFEKFHSGEIVGLIHFAGLFGVSAPKQTELLKVWLTLQPVTINLEDQFINFIIPTLNEFERIVRGHAKLCSESTTLKVPIHEMIQNHVTPRRSNVTCALTGRTHTLTPEESESDMVLLPFVKRRTSVLSTPLSKHILDTSSDAISDNDREFLSDYLAGRQPRRRYPIPDCTEEKFFGLEPTTSGVMIGNSSFFIGPISIEHSRVQKASSTVLQLSPDELIDKILTNLKKNDKRSIRMPEDVLNMMRAYADPIYLQEIMVKPVTVFVTMRMSSPFYIAVDHSPLHLAAFFANPILTTSFELGQTFANHYLSGAIYKSGNPIRIIGSMELLGSPGPFVRSVTTGVKDFIVYPYEGLFKGPLGFLTGVSHGCGSLVKNVGAGTLTSVTNWAWSVSRNFDRLTMERDEQIQHEEGRRAHIDGFVDGLYYGLTGLGIRLLGAVGGITHHPIQSVIESGSAGAFAAGIGKGLIGVFTKPIGGAVEFVAMTGQGLLRGAGWTPKFERQNELFIEDISSSRNSFLKHHWRLRATSNTSTGPPGSKQNLNSVERVLLVLDATESSSLSKLLPVSLVLTTENLFVVNAVLDEVEKQIDIGVVVVEATEENMLIRLKNSPAKNLDDVSLAQERVIDFVRSSATSNPLVELSRSDGLGDSVSVNRSSDDFVLDNGATTFGDFLVDPASKCEFLTLLRIAQKEKIRQLFPVLR